MSLSKNHSPTDRSTVTDGAVDETAHHGIVFWTSAAIGVLLIAYGARGVLTDRAATPPRGFTEWFLGSAVVHDALLAPCVFAVAWAVGRVLPRPAVVPVRLGLATTALLVAFAWPLVRGYGRRDSNPTALPLDYGRNLALSLVAVWLVVVAAIATSVVRRRRHRVFEGTAPQ